MPSPSHAGSLPSVRTDSSSHRSLWPGIIRIINYNLYPFTKATGAHRAAGAGRLGSRQPPPCPVAGSSCKPRPGGESDPEPQFLAAGFCWGFAHTDSTPQVLVTGLSTSNNQSLPIPICCHQVLPLSRCGPGRALLSSQAPKLGSGQERCSSGVDFSTNASFHTGIWGGGGLGRAKGQCTLKASLPSYFSPSSLYVLQLEEEKGRERGKELLTGQVWGRWGSKEGTCDLSKRNPTWLSEWSPPTTTHVQFPAYLRCLQSPDNITVIFHPVSENPQPSIPHSITYIPPTTLRVEVSNINVQEVHTCDYH